MALPVATSVLDCIVLTTLTSSTAKDLAYVIRRNCTSKWILRSKWSELSSSFISDNEAVAAWETFVTLIQAQTNQYGDWIDVRTLCILILLQVYRPRRYRIQSELWQDTNALSSPRASPRVAQSPRSIKTDHGCDDADKVAFVKESMASFVEILCDDANDVKSDIAPHLAFLFSADNSAEVLLTVFCEAKSAVSVEAVAQQIRDRISDNSGEDLVSQVKHTTWIQLPPEVDGFPSAQTSVPRKVAKIKQCERAHVYITEPIKIVTISLCSGCEVVLTGCSMLVLKNCSKMNIHVNAQSIIIINCIDVTTYACVRNRPVILGDSRGLTFAPCNIISSRLNFCVRELNIEPSSKDCMMSWCQPIVLVRVSSGTSKVYTLLKPERFSILKVPEFKYGLTANALIVPEVYRDAWESQMARVAGMQKLAAERINESSMHDYHLKLGQHFQNWLASTGNMRQIEDLRAVEKLVMALPNCVSPKKHD